MKTTLEAIRGRQAQFELFGIENGTLVQAFHDRAFLLKLVAYARHDDSDDGHICGTRLNRPCDCGLTTLLEQPE